MARKRHMEKQIVAVLKDAQAGVSVQDLSRRHGILDATFYKWRTKYAGLIAAAQPARALLCDGFRP